MNSPHAAESGTKTSDDFTERASALYALIWQAKMDLDPDAERRLETIRQRPGCWEVRELAHMDHCRRRAQVAFAVRRRTVRRPNGREGRPATNARPKGSKRRTTGSGTSASGEDDPPSSGRLCANCSRPLPADSARQRRYCAHADCKRERARLRKQAQRARLAPQEDLWDPVARREIPATHKRATSEEDEAGARGRYERIQLAISQRDTSFKLVEKIGCKDCAEAYLRDGYGARCFEHWGKP